MALVLLPCDLPFWPACQRELNDLRSARSGAELKHGLLRIYNLCNTSLEPEEFECGVDQTVFDLLAQLVDDADGSFSPTERCAFFNIQLPTMIDFALQLKSLKPTKGLHFSLQQQSDRVQVDRRLAASLTAHAFFSTFPRRTIRTHPTLQDFNFAGHFFQHLHRRQQRSKLRSILHYFQRLSERPPPPGHVTFARQVMSGREWCTLDEWLQCRLPLCPLVVRHEGRLEAQEANAGAAAVRVCFASAKIGGAFLGDDATSQECAVFSSHPELLSLLPFTESLEDNEAISASGLANYSIIHDDPPAVGGGSGGGGLLHVEGNKAVSHPGARQTHNNNNNISSSNGPTSSSSSAISNSPLQQQTVMCLIDAEDYSDLPIRQYEEDNVLRELNKAYVGFRQTPVMAKQQQQQMEHRLPPVGASRDSSPSSRTIATPSQQKENQHGDDLTRSETLVAEELQQKPNEPTLLYGGGRNAPLTLTKATVVKQLKDGRPPSLAHQHRSVGGGSQYASCDSQSSSTHDDEFRSANTSVDLPDDTQSPSVHRRQSTQDGHRQDSSDSNVSADSDRPGSRGFALEGQGAGSEEDSFSGDGLERERQWLKEFRERRGGPRSSSNSKSSSSPSSSSGSKDSSRYSFSTEFSSELDELYDQFSHWLEEPGTNGESGSGANGRNAAVFRFAHSLLKRALSDSFASVAMNIENLSSRPEARMKDIKLSSNGGGGQCRKDKGQQKRSWSLAEHMGDERLALQLAKEMIMEQEMEQVHPMPEPVTAAETAETNSGGDEADEESDGGGGEKKKTAITSARPSLRNDQFFVIPRGPVPVRLLDRMSPVHDDPFTPQPLATCNESSTRGSSQAGDGDSDYQQLPPAPMNPTPPRTRRGSWIFKKSREQRHLHPGGIKHQRARSNSVPTVMDLTQLTLWQQQLAEKQQQRGFIPPDIIVSGEDSNAEDEDGKDQQQQQRRHRSYDDQLQNFAQSNESLLSDDVVEGFSWTMAETIIEDILKDIGSKQAQLSLPKRNHCGGKQDPSAVIPSASLASKRKPGKSILKISSNDSLNRSHSGSLEMTRTGSDGPPSPLVFSAVGPSSNGGGADKNGGVGGGGCNSAGISEHHQQQMSWSQRSTSMPSLRAIDELGSFNRLSSSSSRSPTADGASQKVDESCHNDGDAADGRMLPIITGNWGCGSSAAGDAQLKSMIQWMAASRSGAPSLIYFTAGSPTVVKLDIVCRVIMDRQWTVGDLAGAVLRYCRCRLDPRRLNLIVAASSSSSNFGADVGATSLSSPTDHHRLLFDELLGPLKQTEL